MNRMRYWMLLGAYTALLRMLVPFYFARMILRGLKDRGQFWKWHERLAFYGAQRPERQSIWIHAVSVGEIACAAPLIERLRAAYPQFRVVITTTTLTSARWVQQRFGETVQHRFLPLDLPGAVDRFLRREEPALGVVMESEIWPNLFAACRRHTVPLTLLNARMSDRSFKRYLSINRHGLLQPLFECIEEVVAQSAEDARRYRQLLPGSVRVIDGGNLKFDSSSAQALTEKRAARCSTRPTWIAGSTHPDEEMAVASAHRAVRHAQPDAMLIWAPRHPERARDVARRCTELGLSTALRTEGAGLDTHADVLIVNTIGELAGLYAQADVAFIGGTFSRVGGHNPLEAVVRKVPVISGPHTNGLRPIYEALDRASAIAWVKRPEQLGDAVLDLLEHPERRAELCSRGQEALRPHYGATDLAMRRINALLTAQRPPTAQLPVTSFAK